MNHKVLLTFIHKASFLRDALSAVVQVGNDLWLANDETTSVERLHQQVLDPKTGTVYAEHTRFALQDYLALPLPPPSGQPDGEEIDIEGLAFDDNCLWLIGSHSLKRKPVKADKSAVDNIQRLQKVSRAGNRFLLARLPLDAQQNPIPPTAASPLLAAQLPGNDKGNVLIQALSSDEHLKAFLDIPSKDNGLDIEGLAVSGSQVWLGLRGPVLRGWAVILHLQIATDPNEAKHLQLQAMQEDCALYRKHFLDLNGLGVRDLCLDGDDILILAGPTMELDGPVRIYRWINGSKTDAESLVSAEQLTLITEVAYGQAEDHAEGMTLFKQADGSHALLLVYDNAAQARKVGSDSVYADVLPLTAKV